VENGQAARALGIEAEDEAEGGGEDNAAQAHCRSRSSSQEGLSLSFLE
jgi:hypothetical protein